MKKKKRGDTKLRGVCREVRVELRGVKERCCWSKYDQYTPHELLKELIRNETNECLFLKERKEEVPSLKH